MYEVFWYVRFVTKCIVVYEDNQKGYICSILRFCYICRMGLWVPLGYYVISCCSKSDECRECGPLDMRTGALEWDAGIYFL